jgi:hypothetical protein
MRIRSKTVRITGARLWPRVAGLVCVLSGAPGAAAEAPPPVLPPTLEVDGRAVTLTAVSSSRNGAVYRTPYGEVHDELVRVRSIRGGVVDGGGTLAAPVWKRRVRLSYRGDGPIDVTGLTLDFQLDRPVGDSWIAQTFAFAETGRNETICVAWAGPDEVHPHLTPGDASAPNRLGHRVKAGFRLSTGQTAEVGTQYVWRVPGPIRDARQTTQPWYRLVGWTVPEDAPDWRHDLILYQLSAGGSANSRFGDLGGFANTQTLVDHLTDLGFNGVWLQSVDRHKVPGDPDHGWNLYVPRTYHEVDPTYGTPDQLRELVNTFKGRGWRVLGEIVPHGGATPEARDPALWIYNRKGERVIWHNAGVDFTHPRWRSLIRQHAQRLTEQFGFDGFRIDVAEGFGTNWNAEHYGPHRSATAVRGASQLVGAIRQGAREGGGAGLMLPESETRSAFAPVASLSYGWEFTAMLRREPLSAMTPTQRVQLLRGFLEHEQGSLPPGMVVMRALDNHDTVIMSGHARHRYGPGLQRALLGLISVIDGFPMIYQNEDVGQGEALRRLLWTRRSCEPLRRGRSDYDAVLLPPGVLGVLRESSAGTALGLVNFAAAPMKIETVLPRVFRAHATDVLAGHTHRLRGRRLTFTLPAYATAVLVPGQPNGVSIPEVTHRPPIAASLAEAFGPGPSPTALEGLPVAVGLVAQGADVKTRRVGDAYEVTTAGDARAEVELRFAGVDGWRVQTASGPLADRLSRRYFPWPGDELIWEPRYRYGAGAALMYGGGLPMGRLWQAEATGLGGLAAGGHGVIDLISPTGHGVRIEVLEARAGNIALEDNSDRLTRLRADGPLGLRLRFMARDEMTRPRRPLPWRGAGWEVRSLGKQDPPLKVRLRLTALAPDAAPPPEVFVPTARGTVAESHTDIVRLALLHPVFERPGSVSWTGLPLDESGDYTLYLPLRADVGGRDVPAGDPIYQITFNGEAHRWDWHGEVFSRLGGVAWRWAAVPLGGVSAGAHEFKVQITQPWGGLQRRPVLVQSGARAP